MKRDLDLIRSILLRAEESEDFTLKSSDFVNDQYDERMVARHFRLLDEAGYIDANLLIIEGYGAHSGELERLTWEGHDFVDAIRNDTVWNQTKDVVKKEAGSVPLEVVKAIATNFVLSIVGLK